MLTQPVTAALARAFSKHSDIVSPVLAPPRKRFGGDVQCNGVMELANRIGANPTHLAQSIVDDAGPQLVGIATLSVSGPGFINVVFEEGHVEACARATAKSGIGSGDKSAGTVVLDFGGPNIAKALHVGHLRSFVIGESLRRILIATGHRVVADIHFGDWGLPIGKLFIGLEMLQLGAFVHDAACGLPELDLETLSRAYAAGNAATKQDATLLSEARALTRSLQAGETALLRAWKHVRSVSLEAIMSQIDLLGAHFDTFDGESDVNDLIDGMIDDLSAAGLAFESDGALVMSVSDDPDRPPLLLRKSDGAALYGTTDLATIADRIARYAPDRIVYCVDGRQSEHLGSVFDAARRAHSASVPGFEKLPEFVHADFGTVNDRSGKAYSTRDGGPALLSDLTDAAIAAAGGPDVHSARSVGIAALKFADLSTDRKGGYVFDPDRMTATTGRTGPYLQYAHARIRSVLAKAEADGGAVPGEIAIAHPSDRTLALECLGVEASLREAAASLQPKEICDRAYAIASAVSGVYADTEILRAPPDERAGRLALLAHAGDRLAFCLDLIGIEAPDRM